MDNTYIVYFQLCIPEEGKLLPCHKRVGRQAGQGTGQVVAVLDSSVAEAGLDRVPGPDKQLVELKRTMFPAVQQLSICQAALQQHEFGVLAVLSSEHNRWPGPHIWGYQ